MAHTTRSVSPRAVLEIFVGSKHALDAPEWTQWTRPSLQFQQPRALFAALFAWMALWDVNRDDVIFSTFDVPESRADVEFSQSTHIK